MVLHLDLPHAARLVRAGMTRRSASVRAASRTQCSIRQAIRNTASAASAPWGSIKIRGVNLDVAAPDAYHARREKATGLDAMNDLAMVREIVERVLLDKDSSCLDDDDTRWHLEVALERLGSHARFPATTFSRGAVNRGFRAGDHRRLMHQPMY